MLSPFCLCIWSARNPRACWLFAHVAKKASRETQNVVLSIRRRIIQPRGFGDRRFPLYPRMQDTSEAAMIDLRRVLARTALPAAILLFFATFRGAFVTAQDRNENTLRKLNESVDALIRKVSPSVVQILVTGYGPIDSGEHSNTAVVIGRQRAIGSGFVIDPAGYIITNAHVVSGAQRVQVVVPEGPVDGSLQAILSARTNIVPARVVGVARDIDVALLKVDNVKLAALPLAPYRNIHQGEVVLAFGSPEGLRNTVTFGVVSSVARQIDPDSPMVYIQTDAPINPGNSGGPLVNVDGEVIGVNTFILSQSGGNEGLGFAIPSSVVNVAFRQLLKFGHLHRAEIGIGIQTITPSMAAALRLPRTYGVSSPTFCRAAPPKRQAFRSETFSRASTGRQRTVCRWWPFISTCCRRETKSVSTSFAEKIGWFSTSP